MLLWKILKEWLEQVDWVRANKQTFKPHSGIELNYLGGHMKYAELIVEGVVVVSGSHVNFEKLLMKFENAMGDWLHSIPEGYEDILKFDDFANDVAGKYKGQQHESVDQDWEFEYDYEEGKGSHVFSCVPPGGGKWITSIDKHFDIARYIMRHRLLVDIGFYKDSQYAEEFLDQDAEFGDLLAYLNGGAVDGR